LLRDKKYLGKICEAGNAALLSHCTDDNAEKNHIEIKIKQSDMVGWTDMLARLNTTNNNIYQSNIDCKGNDCVLSIFYKPLFLNGVSNYPYWLLHQAIAKKEYYFKKSKNGHGFDLKLGYSCNNNCRHCVIKPNLWKIERETPAKVKHSGEKGMVCGKDLSFDDVVNDIFRSHDFLQSTSVVLTGGEPTVRPDFIKILRWLYYNRPDMQVSLQTNGRMLSDIELVKKMRRYTRNFYAVVAIHGPEEVHNYIVNNRKDKGNPYLETVAAIHNLREIFKDSPSFGIRTEIVLSNYNYGCLFENIVEQHQKMGIKEIGISYPHLDGFDADYVSKVAPKMKDLIPLLKKINGYLKEHPDLSVAIEEIPLCIYAQFTNSLMIEDMSIRQDNVKVAYLEQITDDFYQLWLNSHKKTCNCCRCAFNDYCVGVWWENYHLNVEALIPILKKEDLSFERVKNHNS